MSDPVFLITGASSGIGAAVARAASAAGWRVALAARSAAKLQTLATELGGPDRALALRCDVTSFDSQSSAVARTLSQYGRLDAALANAGFGRGRSFLEGTPERMREMVSTNVLGAAFTVRATLPALTDARGHLLLTGSVAGHRVLSGSLYSVTKHAVGAMAESARQELNGTGVRVTLVSPGQVDTPFFDDAVDWRLAPEDVARAVMFAVSEPPHVDVNEILVRPTAQDG